VSPELNQYLATLAVCALVLNAALYGFTFMIFGAGRAARLLHWEKRALRSCVGIPIVWLGQFVVWSGKQIRG
jgi:hypothetical protein